MKAMLQRLIRRAGYDLHRVNPETDIGLFVPMLLSHLGVTCVLDVGANEGQYGRAIRQGGYRGDIISFEPVPTPFAALQKVAAPDPHWTAYPSALGDRDGQMEMQVSNASVFSSFLSPSGYGAQRFPRELGESGVHMTTVEIARLDTIIDRITPPGPLFLKLDTQGYDLRVLEGASGCLERIVALQTEVAIRPLYEGVPDYREALRQLEAMGFAIAAVFNLHRDTHLRLGEFDCVLVRHAADRNAVSTSMYSHW